MIKLFQYPSRWSLPNVSPFCMKMETYLRMVKLPFQIVKVLDPRKAPKGKLPYIEDDGLVIADSSLIIEYLKQKYGDPLDAKLSNMQKAQGLALQRLLEEHLYWVVVYSRWIDMANWPTVKKAFFGKLSVFTRGIVATMIRKHTQRELYYHGIGRHTADEIYASGIKDLEALTIFLADNSFILGNEATSIDASGYALVANILQSPVTSPLQDYVKSHKHLVDYSERMREQFYT